MKALPVTAARFLKQCEVYVGIGENPKGSNRNSITRWYGLAAAWCMMSMSKVCWDIGVLEETWGRKMAYTVDGYERGKKLGLLVDPRGKYEPGDFVFFNFGDPDYGGRPLGIHHVGTAIVDLGGGKFASYEGNTGDDFKKRIRSKRLVAAVVRFPWRKQLFAPKPKGRFTHMRKTALCYLDEAMTKPARTITGRLLYAKSGGEVKLDICRGGRDGIRWGGSLMRRVWVAGSSVGKPYVR